MNDRNFRSMLKAQWARGNFVCVGLDSNYAKIPESVRYVHLFGFRLWRRPPWKAVLRFNRAIVDVTKNLICAYKPNIAFYEALGEKGLRALRETVKYIHREAQGVPVILDGKRGDIGNTNAGYVKMAFDYLRVDAITVPPYLGRESLKPFLLQPDKGVIVLCRTSNPGAGEFQDLPVSVSDERFDAIARGQPADSDGFSIPREMPLYQYVAWQVANRRGWNVNGNCGVVVGATYPGELAEVRRIVGDMPILIPAVGFQQKDVPLEKQVERVVSAGKDSRGQGMIINSSRGVIFASSNPDFAEAARRETKKLHDLINRYR